MPKKTSLVQTGKKAVKSTKKSSGNIKNEEKEFSDLDSLSLLNNFKERKKLDGIDERIKILKSELKSLLGNTKADKNSDCFTHKNNFVSDTLVNHDTEGPEALKPDVKSTEKDKNIRESQTHEINECNINFNSAPSTFSEWLDKTIDEMNVKYENEKLDNSQSQTNLKQIDLTVERFPNLLLTPSKLNSNVNSWSQQHIEQLLYKSFLMQDSVENLYSPKANSSESNQYPWNAKRQNFGKSRRNKKCTKRRSIQSNFSPLKRFDKKGVKRKTLNSSVSLRGIEVINLDSSSGWDTKTNIDCVDLDVSNYDWSEPFDINKEGESHHSETWVAEKSNGKNDEMNCKELNFNTPEVNRSASDDSEKISPKKAWECPICFEGAKGQEVVATQCGHVFCRKCLENHVSKLNRNCPSCRSDLKDKQFITLFNF